MADLDDCMLTMGSELKNALFVHSDHCPWHYALNLTNNAHPNRLASYLNLSQEQYQDVLDISGLAKKRTFNQNFRWTEMIYDVHHRHLVRLHF